MVVLGEGGGSCERGTLQHTKYAPCSRPTPMVRVAYAWMRALGNRAVLETLNGSNAGCSLNLCILVYTW